MSQSRVALTILTTPAVMFILMFLYTYAFRHMFFSEMRASWRS